MHNIKIFFNEPKLFEPKTIRQLEGVIGLYFILLTNIEIQYPFRKSKLIYIGMSEKRTNSIGNRLIGHFEGQSGNQGLINYRKVEDLQCTYINFEILKKVWPFSVEDLESYFLLDFVEHYGVYPICNNKTGFEILKKDLQVNFEIDWKCFEKEDNYGEKN